MTFEYKEEYKYLSNACLNITDDCVLKCTYCFVEQHPHYMTLDTAKAAVDYLLNNLHIKKEKKLHSESDKTFINYFGGEPTMLWDEIIVPLTLYMEEKYPIRYLQLRLSEELRVKAAEVNEEASIFCIFGIKSTQKETVKHWWSYSMM